MKKESFLVKTRDRLEDEIPEFVKLSAIAGNYTEQQRLMHMAGVNETARRVIDWVLDDGDEDLVL